MSTMLRFLVLFLSAASSSFGVGTWLGLDDLLQADLIARVTVVSITNAPADSRYTRLAHATVTDPVKGANVGDTVVLFSAQTVISCPYIAYGFGDDCIVVARRLPSGIFETMNSSAGRFPIYEGKIDLYPFWRPIYPGRPAEKARNEMLRTDFRNKTPTEILAALRRLLPAVEQEMQHQKARERVEWWQFWR